MIGPAREWRDKIAAALRHEGYCRLWMPRGKPCQCQDRTAALDALLPTVAGIVAGELRAAAEELVKDGRPDLTTTDQVQAVNDAAAWLDARADEIDPA